ncbi:hypothetical protein AX17_003674 [Amanita inopinata Kibby_2008]|nr:hypothetical protein AX17_003674 [Amanita inopinata Kibby_2008]
MIQTFSNAGKRVPRSPSPNAISTPPATPMQLLGEERSLSRSNSMPDLTSIEVQKQNEPQATGEIPPSNRIGAVSTQERGHHTYGIGGSMKKFGGLFRPRIVLENKGNVARDHLALERTFLAYVRTSLAVSTAGVALVQLFAITRPTMEHQFKNLARPMGAVMVAYGLVILLMGMWRYFQVQRSLARGLFPLFLHGIGTITFVLAALSTVIFGVLVANRS